jgi:hypothetical protein
VPPQGFRSSFTIAIGSTPEGERRLHRICARICRRRCKESTSRIRPVGSLQRSSSGCLSVKIDHDRRPGLAAQSRGIVALKAGLSCGLRPADGTSIVRWYILLGAVPPFFRGGRSASGGTRGKGGLGGNPWDVVPAGIPLQTGARCSPFSSQALGASVRPNEILSGFPCFVSLSPPHLRPSGRRTRLRHRTRARAFSRRPTSRGEKRRRSRRLAGGRRRGPLPRGIVVVCR